MATVDLGSQTPVRYLVAKYIADTWRMEPRNVGVIVLGPDGAVARFIGERPARPGWVDGRALRGWMRSQSAYREWIRYWRKLLSAADEPPSTFNALLESSKGNFQLAEGGALLDKVDNENLNEVADFLYVQLVQRHAQPEEDFDLEAEPIAVAEQLSLDVVCDSIIQRTSLPSSPHFINDYHVKCRVRPDVPEEEDFLFSHAYQNGNLRLFQRVPFGRGQTLRRVVHDSAWMFEKVVENKFAERDSCVALVYAPPQQRSAEIDHMLRVLNVVSRVVDVSNESYALAEFRALAALDT